MQLMNYLLMVSNIQIECEIDIRTLTSHQVLGQIWDQIWGQVWGIRKYSVQFYWDGEIQCTVLLGQKIQCTVLLGQKIQERELY